MYFHHLKLKLSRIEALKVKIWPKWQNHFELHFLNDTFTKSHWPKKAVTLDNNDAKTIKRSIKSDV